MLGTISGATCESDGLVGWKRYRHEWFLCVEVQTFQETWNGWEKAKAMVGNEQRTAAIIRKNVSVVVVICEDRPTCGRQGARNILYNPALPSSSTIALPSSVASEADAIMQVYMNRMMTLVRAEHHGLSLGSSDKKDSQLRDARGRPLPLKRLRRAIFY